MTVRHTRFLLTFLLFAITARAQIITNGSFETPDIPSNSEQYVPGATFGNWTFFGNNGGFIDAPSAFGAPTPPDGTQLAFLQSSNVIAIFTSMSQMISLPQTGLYTLSFFDAGRPTGGNAGYNVLLDNVVFYSDATTNGQPFTLETVLFVATAGTHTLTFRLTQSTGPDNTAFFDQVQIVPEPSAVALLVLCLGGFLVTRVAGGGPRRNGWQALCSRGASSPLPRS